MANRNITIDRQGKAIVSYAGSVAGLAPFYQSNTETFQIQVVDPSGDNLAPWTVVDYAGAAGLRVTFSSRATGTRLLEDDFLLARTLEAGWTWNASTDLWTGAVGFNTDRVEDFLAGADEKTVILEVNVVTAGLPITILQVEVVLRANVDEGSATVPAVNPPSLVQVPLLHGSNGISINENLVSVTLATAWASAPTTILIWIDLPDATVTPLRGNLLRSTLATTGFSFIMNTSPDAGDYRLNYIAYF